MVKARRDNRLIDAIEAIDQSRNFREGNVRRGAPAKGKDMDQKNACRHFLGMYPDSRPQCAKGRDVRAWAIRCNGGSNLGIDLHLPCAKQAPDAEKPLFDCPELDRKTDEEVEKARSELRAAMDRLISTIGIFSSMKKKMIAHGLSKAKATCPFCGAKDKMRVFVALGVNNHMRAQCAECGEGFIE